MAIDFHPGDELIKARAAIELALRSFPFPDLVEETVTDDGETYEALRCPRCEVLVEPGELYAVSPGDHFAPVGDIDDDSFDHSRLFFDSSERPDLDETLYYQHVIGDDAHAVRLPAGWTEDWV